MTLQELKVRCGFLAAEAYAETLASPAAYGLVSPFRTVEEYADFALEGGLGDQADLLSAELDVPWDEYDDGDWAAEGYEAAREALAAVCDLTALNAAIAAGAPFDGD